MESTQMSYKRRRIGHAP